MTHILNIFRRKSTDFGTPGKLTIEDEESGSAKWACDTLELAWHGNQRGISCIKADAYKGWLWYSPSFKRWVIRLEDKYGRFDCLLHNGNFAGDEDKGLLTQVKGCTLIGRGYADIEMKNHGAGYTHLEVLDGTQFGISASRVTLDELIRQLGGDLTFLPTAKQPAGTDVLVTYTWEEGARPEDDV